MPTPDLLTALVVVLAGVAGGAINGIVGSGTLIVYPVLLGVGVSPVTANATNTSGLGIGSFTSAWAYRRELAGRWRLLMAPLMVSVVGSTCGVLLVTALPERVFAAAVPFLILAGAGLVAVQPLLVRWLRSRSQRMVRTEPSSRRLIAGVGASSVYGGYFGAGQGVVLMAILGAFYDADVQRANAAKNLLSATANVTAAVVFALSGRIWWLGAILIAVGAIAGGYTGAMIAQRLPPQILRAAVVSVGVIAALAIWIQR